MRMQAVALMGLMTPNQSLFASKTSQIYVKESSSPSDASDKGFEEHPVENIQIANSIKNLVKNKNKTDQRFIDLYRLRKANLCGTKVFINGFNYDEKSKPSDYEEK